MITHLITSYIVRHQKVELGIPGSKQFETQSSRNSLNTSLQRPKIRAPNPLNLLPILHKHKSRHGSDAKLRSHTAQLININLHKADILVLLAQFADLGRDGAAGSTPGCVEVDDGGAGVD